MYTVPPNRPKLSIAQHFIEWHSRTNWIFRVCGFTSALIYSILISVIDALLSHSGIAFVMVIPMGIMGGLVGLVAGLGASWLGYHLLGYLHTSRYLEHVMMIVFILIGFSITLLPVYVLSRFLLFANNAWLLWLPLLLACGSSAWIAHSMIQWHRSREIIIEID